ncbi:MAG: ACT domain-containing protein [Oscillospiraceae bacterium]
MWTAPKYLVVENSVLPEVFQKVVYAKHLMETKKVKSVSEAAKKAGISRSVIYKYKDSVFPYVREMSGKVVSIYLLLWDKPGVLSEVIALLYDHGANILTINQNIPVDSVAAVSISITLDAQSPNDMEIVSALKNMEGVLDARKIDSH